MIRPDRPAVLLATLVLLLAACGSPSVAPPEQGRGATGASPSPTAVAAALVIAPTALPPMIATHDPRLPTATAALPVATAFPTLAAGVPYVYIVDYQRTIRVVDPRTMTVVGELPVGWGAQPVFSPDGSRLYVAHYLENGGQGARLDVFDVATGHRVAGVADLEVMAYKVWGPPIIAPARDGRTVYVHGRRITSRPGEAGRDTCWIYVFDVDAGRLTPDTIPLPACRVAALVLSADGRTLYSGPWLVDLTTQPATVRENPDLADRAVAQSGDGRWLYALDRSGNIAVWDTDARRVARTLPGAVPAYGSYVYLPHQTVQLSRDGARLFVATDDGDAGDQSFKGVVTLDSGTGQRLGLFRTGQPFQEFTVSADGTEYYLLARSRPTPDTLEVALEGWDIATRARRGSVRDIGGDSGPMLTPPAAR